MRLFRYPRLQLKRNCLLTRYPLILLHTHGSSLLPLTRLNRIKHFLSEHGYETLILPAAYDPAPRISEICTIQAGAHLFLPAGHGLKSLPNEEASWRVTFNAIEPLVRGDLQATLDAFLEKAVHLAEQDFIQGL